MRTIPTALQTKLDSGVTTLCRCWLITRNDGITQGFTDHDEDVVIDGAICLAGSGLSGSEATQKLGLAVDGSEISGALSDDFFEREMILPPAATTRQESNCGWWTGASRICGCCWPRARSARCGARARRSRRKCAA